MRDNAQKMAELEKQRAADANSMTAVDVVKSYSEVIDAHEDGMKKFIPGLRGSLQQHVGLAEKDR